MNATHFEKNNVDQNSTEEDLLLMIVRYYVVKRKRAGEKRWSVREEVADERRPCPSSENGKFLGWQFSAFLAFLPTTTISSTPPCPAALDARCQDSPPPTHLKILPISRYPRTLPSLFANWRCVHSNPNGVNSTRTRMQISHRLPQPQHGWFLALPPAYSLTMVRPNHLFRIQHRRPQLLHLYRKTPHEWMLTTTDRQEKKARSVTRTLLRHRPITLLCFHPNLPPSLSRQRKCLVRH